MPAGLRCLLYSILLLMSVKCASAQNYTYVLENIVGSIVLDQNRRLLGIVKDISIDLKHGVVIHFDVASVEGSIIHVRLQDIDFVGGYGVLRAPVPEDPAAEQQEQQMEAPEEEHYLPGDPTVPPDWQ